MERYCRAGVQTGLTYGTETWAMKADHLHSQEDGADDGEMDVWSVAERQKAQCEFVQALGIYRVWRMW